MYQVVLNDTIEENIPIQQLLVEMRIQGTYVRTHIRTWLVQYFMKSKTARA